MSENYPIGAKYDSNAPWNEPEDLHLHVNVDVSLSIYVDIPQYREGKYLAYNEDELKEVVELAIKDKLKDKDIIINDYYIN